jgi:hypothetical protein
MNFSKPNLQKLKAHQINHHYAFWTSSRVSVAGEETLDEGVGVGTGYETSKY